MKKPETQAADPPRDFELTADEVKALQVGSCIEIIGEDKDGIQRRVTCTVAGLPGRKFLTYRIHGKLKKCAIKQYPGKSYVRVV